MADALGEELSYLLWPWQKKIQKQGLATQAVEQEPFTQQVIDQRVESILQWSITTKLERKPCL
jgi:hypothetical protein